MFLSFLLLLALFSLAVYLLYRTRSKGMTERAPEHFLITRRLAPNDPKIYNKIGKAYSISSNTKEAISFFERAVALHPSNPEYRFNLQNAKEVPLRRALGSSKANNLKHCEGHHLWVPAERACNF